MVKLRLTRLGRKDNPVYRIVAADARSPRDGRIIEQVGTYNVMKNEVSVDQEKTLKWLNNGAQPTDTVKSILSKQGIWKEFKEKK